MEIKEEKKVIEQVTNIYIADDGKEFKTQKECEKYENNLLLVQLEEKAMAIKHISFTPVLVDNDHEYKWFYVTNQEELNAIQDYYNNSYPSYGINYEDIVFPEWVGIEEGYDGDIWEAGTLTRYQNNVLKMVEHFNKQK